MIYDTWYHLVLICDKENLRRSFYLNEIFVGSLENDTGVPILGTGPAYIGKNNIAPIWYFDGYIDEIMAFESVLTPEDIKILYGSKPIEISSSVLDTRVPSKIMTKDQEKEIIFGY